MQVTETKAEGLKRAYAVKVPAAELGAKIDAKLEAVRADFQMKGFRKGKAPAPLLKKMFGKSVLGEAVQETVDEAMRQHFTDSGDQPAAQPDVKITNEDFKEGDDLDIEIAYERLPEIPELDFKAIKLERMVVEVEDDAVGEALQNLADSAKDFEDKDGPAADGDQVVLDFVGKVDGEAFEGGSAEDFPLTLGSNQFIPGFEEKLVGAQADEERDVEVTFPENYQAANLAGKDAVFSCKIKQVRGPKPAEVNDALAERFGAENLDALKGQIGERLAAEYKGAGRALMKRALLDALDEMASFDLPDSLVDVEAKQIAHQLWRDKNPDAKPEDAPAEADEEAMTLAKRRVGLGLLLADVGRKAEIQVSNEELSGAIMQQARQYPGQEKAFFDFVRQNEQALAQIRAPIFEDKVVDYIVELADVSEKSVTKDELQKALDALDDE